MSISNYCIDQIVRSKIDNMDDHYFTKYMMSEEELINTLNSTINIVSSRRLEYDKDLYVIDEQFINDKWEYHLKKSLKGKVQLSNEWINTKNRNIYYEYIQQIQNFKSHFIDVLNYINKRKIGRYLTYKIDVAKYKRNIIKKKYYKLKYVTYRYVIMKQLNNS